MPEYRYLFRVLIARMGRYRVSYSYDRNDDADESSLARSRSTYQERLPIKIYARLGKRWGEQPIRLPSYIKCHRALSRFYSWVQAGLYRSARPTNFHLISFRLRRSCAHVVVVRQPHEKSIHRYLKSSRRFSTPATSPLHFPRSPSRSDFILSPREEMAGIPLALRVPELFADNTMAESIVSIP